MSHDRGQPTRLTVRGSWRRASKTERAEAHTPTGRKRATGGGSRAFRYSRGRHSGESDCAPIGSGFKRSRYQRRQHPCRRSRCNRQGSRVSGLAGRSATATATATSIFAPLALACKPDNLGRNSRGSFRARQMRGTRQRGACLQGRADFKIRFRFVDQENSMPRKAHLGMTDTAYGRSRGVTGPAIRKTVLGPPGASQDQTVLSMLPSRTGCGPRAGRKGTVPVTTLAAARTRKLAAQCALLRDELDSELCDLVRPEDASSHLRAEAVLIACTFLPLLKAARAAAGQEPMVANRMLEIAVNEMLQKARAGHLSTLAKKEAKAVPAGGSKPECRDCATCVGYRPRSAESRSRSQAPRAQA